MPNCWLIATNVGDVTQWYGYLGELGGNIKAFIVPVAPQVFSGAGQFLPANVRSFVEKNFTDVKFTQAA